MQSSSMFLIHINKISDEKGREERGRCIKKKGGRERGREDTGTLENRSLSLFLYMCWLFFPVS